MALFDDMAAWYRCFDNTDSTGSYPVVFNSNATSSQAGDNKCGSYWYFPTNGDGVTISPTSIPLNSSDGFTVTSWFYNLYTGSANTWFLQFQNHSPFAIQGTNGEIFFLQDCFGTQAHGTGYILKDNVTPNTWHHIAMTATGSATEHTARYYLDGVLVASATLNGGVCKPITMSAAEYINSGTPSSFNNPVFERLTDVGIWQRALADAEIAQIAAKCIADTGSAPTASVAPLGGSPFWQSREERDEILQKKSTFKLKRLNGKTTLEGIETSNLLETPQFEQVILESSNITSRPDGEELRDTLVTLKMSLGVEELLSSNKNLEDYIKVVIMQSDKGQSSEEAVRIYENFIKDSKSYRKEGGRIFFEIPTTLRNKVPSELSFYAFAYFDLAPLITSENSDLGLDSYTGDVIK